QNQLVLARQRRDLAAPHLRSRRIAMAEQNDRPLAMGFVIDVDAIAREHRHHSPPITRPLDGLGAILRACNELGNSGEFVAGPAMMRSSIQGTGHVRGNRTRDAGESWRQPALPVGRSAEPPARRGWIWPPRTAPAELSVLSPHHTRARPSLAERDHTARHADERPADLQRPPRALLG